MSKSITTNAAIARLRSGESITNYTLSDLGTSKVNAMDALLLADHGFIVPDGNIVYDDSKVAYDPDFDEGEWSEPLSLKEFEKGRVSSEPEISSEKDVKKMKIELSLSKEIKNWIDSNNIEVDLVVNKLLKDFYQTEKLLKR